MTAFAACLFALAALASIWTMMASWRSYGRQALGLRARLAASPGAMELRWEMVERVPLPALAALRKDRAARPVRDRQVSAPQASGWSPALAA
ncbi:hypothetical protein SAMN05518801_11759 [Novosphingobium sp. CF614]|uniref:hypothetical protein n=1 Tax=Novosphingobium sp. CF614 TaxID=1884364 RepID=UPI0008F23D5D|nr:hypothetical protein [Novosphingobium sp. CF614]SFG33523.1 hypothetical protein SAMN05518801_11759 [Novosphingobium sp. CF614]